MQKIFQVDLDIKNPQLKSVPPIEVVSGDTDTNIFNINLLENFKEVNATGNTAVITFVKSDGTTVFQNLTAVNASKGQYTCTLSSQTIAVPGRIKAEVALYEGIKRLTSTRFEFNVRKAILDENTVESSNEFSALTQALSDVTDLKNLAGEGRTVETVKGNADAIKAHKAENVTDADGVHGLKIESGTWSPTIRAEITNPTVTYTAQRGTYVKIGKLVKCSFYVSGTLTGGEGALTIGGFPLVIKNLDEAGVVSAASLKAITLDYSSLYSANNNVSKVRVYKDTRSFVQISEINNGEAFTIGGSITYETV